MNLQVEKQNLLLEEIEKLKQSKQEAENVLVAIQRLNTKTERKNDRTIVVTYINQKSPYYQGVGIIDCLNTGQAELLAKQEKEEVQLGLETLESQLNSL